MLDVARGETDPFFTDATIADTHVRVLTFPVVPGVAVQIPRPLDEVDNTLERLRTFLILISLAGIGLAVALGLLVSRAAIAPVARLTRATERVTETGDLSERIDARGQDELSRLAGSFNAMLGALEESTQAQRQLVADASHELRTPLTSLRTNFEVLMSDRELDPDERRRLLDDVVEQIGEMTTLITELIELARGDKLPSEPEDVRLDLVAQDAVERTRRDRPGVTFNTDLRESVVRGVPRRSSARSATSSTTPPSGARRAARWTFASTTAPSRCETGGRASTKPTCPTSSTGSTVRRPHEACRARAWGWRSSGRSPKHMGARSSPSAPRAAGRGSRCA